MTAQAMELPKLPRKTKDHLSAVGQTDVERRVTTTTGEGTAKGDFSFFVDADPVAQSALIREGIEASIISRLASDVLDMPVQSLLMSLRLPTSTINRKIAQRERLSASESDRVARVLLIHAQAKDVLEDDELASTWLRRANVELGGERPLDMMDTQSAFDRVRDILLRLEHGLTV